MLQQLTARTLTEQSGNTRSHAVPIYAVAVAGLMVALLGGMCLFVVRLRQAGGVAYDHEAAPEGEATKDASSASFPAQRQRRWFANSAPTPARGGGPRATGATGCPPASAQDLPRAEVWRRASSGKEAAAAATAEGRLGGPFYVRRPTQEVSKRPQTEPAPKLAEDTRPPLKVQAPRAVQFVPGSDEVVEFAA